MTGKQLRNSILQWAIQGKLVPQDPNDEPASVLLERIRAEKARLVKEKKIKRDKNETIIYRGEDNSYYEKILATGTVRCIDDEIPFKLPNGWEWIRLGAFVQVKGGKRIPVGTRLTTENTGQIYIRVSDMKDYSVLDSDIHYVPNSIQSSIASYTISSDDIYITVAGTIGRVGLIPSKFDGANLTENANKLSLYEGEKAYLMYVLDSPFVQQQIVDITTKVGQPKLAIIRIQNLLVPICPLQEQARIASRISELQSKINQYDLVFNEFTRLNKSIGLLLKNSIIQDAIQGKLVPQIESESTAEELLEEIRTEKKRLVKEGMLKKSAIANESRIFRGDDNKYYEQIGSITSCIDDQIPFEIPSSWNWIRLGEFVSMNMGKTPPRGEQAYWSNGIYPWVSISDMVDGGKILNTREKISEIAASQIFHSQPSPKGSLLMSFKLTIGKISILDVDAYHNEAIVTINPFLRQDIVSLYLMTFLPMLSLQGDSKDAIKGKTLNSKSLYNILLPLPPLKEVSRIISKVKIVSSKI